MEYGFISLLPAIVVTVFALTTRRTFEALLIGTFCSYIIISGPGFLNSWIETFFEVATDQEVQWVIIVCALFGSLIALLRASSGTIAFSKKLIKICKSGRSSLLITCILGILIFIDDYLNIITLGTCMLPVTDQHKEPREALAYIIDSTAAPVCVLMPISTWAIFYASIFYQQPEIVALGYSNAMDMYLHVIPFTFYAIFTLIIVILFSAKLFPKFGRMKKAYIAAQQRSQIVSNEHEDSNTTEKGTLWDFLIPILIVIVLTIITDEMFIALIIGIFSCLILYLPRRILTFKKFCETFMEGFCSLIPTIAVVFTAFIMQHAANDIGLPAYIISAVKPYMSKELFPALSFAVVSLMTFITGSNWGIPAVCTPIIVPLGCALGVNPLLTMATILSGGTFGSHACFYSDATTLTSTSCSMENMDHALSQLPYTLIGAGLSFICYLIFGFLL